MRYVGAVVSDGRWGLFVHGRALEAILALLDHAHALRTRTGRPPLGLVLEVLREGRHALLLDKVLPQAEADRDPAGAPRAGSPVMSTLQAAQALGVSQRRVAQRCAAETLPARKVAGRWLVDPEGIEHS